MVVGRVSVPATLGEVAGAVGGSAVAAVVVGGRGISAIGSGNGSGIEIGIGISGTLPASGGAGKGYLTRHLVEDGVGARGGEVATRSTS